ncbi:hypothetical protein OROMI_010534 [Orobanche minor]
MSGGKKSGIGADKDPRIVTTFSGVCLTGFAARLTHDEALALRSHDDFVCAAPPRRARYETGAFRRGQRWVRVSKEFEKNQIKNLEKGLIEDLEKGGIDIDAYLELHKNDVYLCKREGVITKS